MKVPFLLISLALHALIFTAPISYVEETREHLVPVTLAIEMTKPEAHKPTPLQRPKNSSEKSAMKQLKPARPKRVKADEIPPLAMAARGDRLLEPDAIAASDNKIMDHRLDAPVSDRQELRVVQSLPTAPEKPPPSQTAEVGEEREIIAERHFPHLGIGKRPVTEPKFFTAHYAHSPKPEYPDQARREGWEGTVLLSILVDAEGKPQTIVLSQSSGFPALDTSARETVKRWRFRPARYGNHRVQSWVKVPIVFTLAEAEN